MMLAIRALMQANMYTWIAVFLCGAIVVTASSFLFMYVGELNLKDNKALAAKIAGGLALVPGVALLVLVALRIACEFKVAPFCVALMGTKNALSGIVPGL